MSHRSGSTKGDTLLEDKKILLTGPAGNIGYPLARELSKRNEVWGISRFGDPAERRKVDDLGVVTRSIDLGDGDFGDVPDDFEYVVHLSAFIFGDDYDQAIRVNAEGTALLMGHCRAAKAFLVMSSTGVYRPNPDPWHATTATSSSTPKRCSMRLRRRVRSSTGVATKPSRHRSGAATSASSSASCPTSW